MTYEEIHSLEDLEALPEGTVIRVTWQADGDLVKLHDVFERFGTDLGGAWCPTGEEFNYNHREVWDLANIVNSTGAVHVLYRPAS